MMDDGVACTLIIRKRKKTKIYMKELVNSVILADVFLFVPPTWLDF